MGAPGCMCSETRKAKCSLNSVISITSIAISQWGSMTPAPSIVSYRSFLHRRESGPRKVAWTHSHSASLGSLPLRAHHLPAGPIARSGKPAGSLVGGVMTSRKVLLCGEILEKMHFHLILEINSTFKIKIKHIK